MLRISLLLFLVSCSFGSVKYGQNKKFLYDSHVSYSTTQLEDLASNIITTTKKNPRLLKWEDVFQNMDITKVSTFNFETIIQSTRTGLTGSDKIYLSNKGKQILTEKLLSIWEETFRFSSKNHIDYLAMNKLFQSNLHAKYGTQVVDEGGRYQDGLESDDIFYSESGKSISSKALHVPHFARDISMLLVPAHQILGQARGTDYQKYYIKELSEVFGLDILFSALVELDWNSQRVDKLTNGFISEKVTIKMKLSPISSYKNAQKYFESHSQKIPTDLQNLNWASYEASIEVPIDLSGFSSDTGLQEIDELFLRPVLKSYTDLCMMMAKKISKDFMEKKIN